MFIAAPKRFALSIQRFSPKAFLEVTCRHFLEMVIRCAIGGAPSAQRALADFKSATWISDRVVVTAVASLGADEAGAWAVLA